ncbi:PaaI family thioesterase [Conexibacter sp. SYSU D00693]|uniref:PaaI family thioesterase n=1 Tax=Conexibacter sp. SYSU D00693 TaxID=2812560 RepID=UPI00196A2B94|nr:PaaI family thioesterase [Conexibacter sp. SYSU D00693]
MTDELAARVQDVLDVELHRLLGLELADPADPAAGLVVAVEGPAVNNVGVLHGGVVSALLDVASYLALLPHLEAGANAVTHDLHASLVRGVQRGARLHVRGEVVRLGRSVAFLRSEARVDGAVVATGTVTKTVLAAR